MKKPFLILVLIFFYSSPVGAKRAAPINVPAVIHGQIEYTAPHSKMGYVEAWDLSSGKMLWDHQVYKVRYIPFLETDVQDIFITGLKIKNGKLIKSNEKQKTFSLDLSSKNKRNKR